MVVCADTSFLFSLYGTDVNSRRALKWINGQRAPLTLSALNEFELGNALRLSEFRKVVAPGGAALFWSQFESDRASGRLKVGILNLADVVAEAKRLSASYTLKAGHRGFDILHVGSALVLKAGEFLTFDLNQKRLAEAEGMKVPF